MQLYSTIMSNIVKTETSPTIQAETIMGMDAMYAAIEKTQSALHSTTVDGESTGILDAELQAAPNKGLLPDTEIAMLQSMAVPMSDMEFKALEVMQKHKASLQYQQRLVEMPKLTLAETTGARVRVAYRLTRYMAHVRGIGKIGKPLLLSMNSRNPQVNLFELPLPYNPTVGVYRGLASVRNLLATAQESDYTYTYLIDDQIFTANGMSVLPPPIHDGYYPSPSDAWAYRRENYVPPGYRGDTDGPLAIYLNMCEFMVRLLGIGENCVEDHAAVVALLNPKIARLAWPCRDEIETFEEYVLLPYVGRIMVAKSQANAIEEFKQVMGVTHAEAFDMVEMYKTYAQAANTFEPEKERSIIISQIQALMQECNDAGMVATQHNTIKTLLQTLGLTTHEEESNVDRREALGSALEAEVIKKVQDSKERLNLNA